MTSPIDIAPDHLKIVREILRKNLPSRVAVWVFGSRANWTTNDSSDLDLALDGDSILDHDTIMALDIAFEKSGLPYKVDIIDMSQVSDSFRRIVKTQKILLTNIDKAERSDDQWPRLKFGDCAKLVHDTILPTGLGDIPYIGLEHIGEGTLSLNGCGNANDVSSVKGRFQKGDVLFGKLRPYFRKIIQADFDGICSTDIWVVRPTTKTDANFLFYMMASKKFVDFATRGSEGTKMPRAKWEWVSRYEVPIPPLTDQQAIVSILKTLDDKIKLNRCMNQTLEYIARTLFRSWFVDFDPVRAKMDEWWRHGESLPSLPRSLYGLFPDTLVDSKLGNIPEGWEVKQFGDVIKVVGGSTPNTKIKEYWDGGIHCWATPKDLSTASSPVLLDTKRKITDAGLSKISSGLLPPGTLLLSSRAPVGYLAISEVPVAINQGFIAMQPYNDMPNLFLLFWCQVFHETIINYANGSTFLEISKTSFRSIPSVIPDVAVLTAFKHVIDPVYNRIVANEYESRNLIMQRDALLPNLMSGKIKLRSYESPVRGAT